MRGAPADVRDAGGADIPAATHDGAPKRPNGRSGDARLRPADGCRGDARLCPADGRRGDARLCPADGGAGTRSCDQQTEATETRGCDQQTDPPGEQAGAGYAVEDIEGLHESLDRAEELAVEMQREAQTLLREKTRVLGELRDARGENSRLIERVALLEGWKQSGELERDRLDLSVRSLEIENEDLRGQLGNWEAAAGGAAAEVSPPGPPLGRAALSPLSASTAKGGGRASSFTGRTPLTVRKMAPLEDDKENTPRQAFSCASLSWYRAASATRAAPTSISRTFSTRASSSARAMRSASVRCSDI